MKPFAFLLALWGLGAVGAHADPVANPAPVPVVRVLPKYPPQALHDRVTGLVHVIATIDSAGHVTDARVISETPAGRGFGLAATTAIQRWTFEPGKPCTYIVTIPFMIPGFPPPPDTPAVAPKLKAHPVYPLDAKAKGIEGDVTLHVVVNADGSIAAIRVVQETPPGYGFGDAAVLAVESWPFPAGAPTTYVVPIQFRR